MELGNAIFGNSRGEYPVARCEIQDIFTDFLFDIGCDGYGHVDKDSVLASDRPHNNSDDPVSVDNKMFTIRPYYWGENEDICDLPNFVYKPEGIEIQWYKYPMRDAYSNVELTAEKMHEIVGECKKIHQRKIMSNNKYTLSRVDFQYIFDDFLYDLGCDRFGNVEKYGAAWRLGSFRDDDLDPVSVDCDLFTLRPYWEYGAFNQLPNFVYKPENIEIRWYAYPLRNAYSNVVLSAEKFSEIIDECLNFVAMKVGIE